MQIADADHEAGVLVYYISSTPQMYTMWWHTQQQLGKISGFSGKNGFLPPLPNCGTGCFFLAVEAFCCGLTHLPTGQHVFIKASYAKKSVVSFGATP